MAMAHGIARNDCADVAASTVSQGDEGGCEATDPKRIDLLCQGLPDHIDSMKDEMKRMRKEFYGGSAAAAEHGASFVAGGDRERCSDEELRLMRKNLDNMLEEKCSLDGNRSRGGEKPRSQMDLEDEIAWCRCAHESIPLWEYAFAAVFIGAGAYLCSVVWRHFFRQLVYDEDSGYSEF
eukprot:TRINITY_DN38005_c0_g1_i2.p2 TRINITY_DN38005_c0_g1~~TRINITY_DN38005_c0_g1_i2.p2  ORF type:complete len:179 (+),score=39.44 TRINITY_DN38005_c0_g1_i2:166-702(+)